MKLGVLTSHPIQYQAPWFRALASKVDLEVFFAHQQSAAEQGEAGFGVSFDWDVDLLSGYTHAFLKNVSQQPGVNHFSGCDTPEIEAVIRKKKFDVFIVSGWYLKAYRQAARACQRCGVALMVRGDSQLGTPRSRFKRVALEVRQRWLLRQFDAFLTVGKRNREYLQHFGVPPRKIFFAPHFVDNKWFDAQARNAMSDRDGLRRSWGASETTLVVLFVGKFQPGKRPQDILHAISRLRDLKIGAVGIFVGAGEIEVELRHLASTLGVTVCFEGFKNQSALPRYYVAADVLVLPSESETWGLVVNEAMACGKPAIVSEAVGCAPDLIDESETGFTFPVGDASSLSERVAALAKLTRAGHDFTPALVEKMRIYSLATAVAGTIRAAEAVAPRRHD
jgi:glycosyltransferase involved in cell wall biosynthesis